MSDPRQVNSNNSSGTTEAPPVSHASMNNNNNSAGNPVQQTLPTGMPVGMPTGMSAGMASAMQSGMPAGMAAGMSAGMAAGMPAAMQAGMQSGIRSPVSQVQLIHSPLAAPPYLSQFPYNQQLMLQNAAVQAAMQAQAQMSQQFNLQAMQGRPPSVSPKSPGIPVLSPSPSLQPTMSAGGVMSTSTTTTSANNNGKFANSKMGNNGNQAQAAMMSGKATMIQRQAATAQPIVIGQIGMVPGQPVSAAGFLPQGCDPSQLINTQAQQLRLTSQQQLVTNTGQIITSQPMLANQALLQAMASLQQPGIPIAHQPLLGTQTPSLIPGQPLYIRAAGPMQTPQSMMQAAAAANIQNINAMKSNQKPMEAPTNLQTTKAPSGMMARSPQFAQGRNFSTILPSTSRPGLSMAKVHPTNLSTHGQQQATKLNIPQVTPKLMKSKSRSHASHKMPAQVTSGSSTKGTTSTLQAKPMTPSTTVTPSNGNRIVASKSPSESESDVSKKLSPSTPPTCAVSATTTELPKSKPAYTKDTNNDTIMGKVSENSGAEKGMTLLSSEEQKVEAMGVVGKSMPKKDVVVEKQKAIVKPHILTHVIEGFIIQEGPEPFPVQRSSLLTDFLPPKPLTAGMKDSEEDDSPYAFRDPTPDEMLNRPANSEEVDLPLLTAPSSTIKCQFCGKSAKADKCPRSKRFCSVACAKRYNVGFTRRIGIFNTSMSTPCSSHVPQRPEQIPSRSLPVHSLSLLSGKCVRKRKHILKMRKGWRSGRGGRLSFNISNSLPLEDNSSSRSEQESSSSVGSPPPGPHETEMDLDEPSPESSPSKWTVQDVYDFIKSITGCSTYAEEFKSQEIDGQALLLLKEDHLMTTMNMKLGPALKICARINSLKEDYV